jgi:hypothetical protein
LALRPELASALTIAGSRCANSVTPERRWGAYDRAIALKPEYVEVEELQPSLAA